MTGLETSGSHQEACLELGSTGAAGGPCCATGADLRRRHAPGRNRRPPWSRILERTWGCGSCVLGLPETSVQGLCPLLSGSLPLYLAIFSHVVV